MKGRDLLELCRVSNLPTVWSNAVLGYFAGIASFDAMIGDLPTRTSDYSAMGYVEWIWLDPVYWLINLLEIILPFSLLYVGGMILNDYIDREIDAKERPGRPIPSGRVKASTAGWLAAGCLTLGLAGVVWMGYSAIEILEIQLSVITFGVVLVMAIIMYNVTHEQNIQSVLLMGACRALIVLTVAAMYMPPGLSVWWLLLVALPAFTLLVYTVLISLVARREVEDESQKRRFAGPKAVMNMIAAMPLLDAVWLVLLGMWPFALFSVACAGLTKVAHREIPGS